MSHMADNWLNSGGHFVGSTYNRINSSALLHQHGLCWDSAGDVFSLSPESYGWFVLTGCCEGDFMVLSEHKSFMLRI